ncbi:LysR family transcriptional regulator [Variovorax defluvii]|uniref:LysR family transcriptional regulator n=2 Tax=Variovorax defluvii TaxID=913761 RepID=A0ABP8I945_9BURK
MVSSRFTQRQLSAFVAVADVRNFGRAGERLNLSPSAVSQLVSELESAVGFRLFDRTTRSVALSPAGREFHASAKDVLKRIELAQIAADDIRNRAAGVVRVAAPMIMASTALPHAISAYKAIHPKVVIRIRDSAVDALIDKVANAEVDLAVGSDRVIGDQVARHPLFRSAWALWCAAGDPLASREQVSWAALRLQPLVLAGYDHERSIALAHAGGGGGENSHVNIVDVVGNISTAFGMAAAGLAVTIAPTYTGSLARTFGLAMCPIAEPPVMQQVCLFHSASRVVSPAAQGFLEHLVAWFGGSDDPNAWGLSRV